MQTRKLQMFLGAPNKKSVSLQTEMPFIHNILKYRSLSIVGLEKNTGKTVCLNYILRRLSELGLRCAVTSIGVDGEQSDSVYGSAKPEITLYDGMEFITSERHYHQRQLISIIKSVDEQQTSLGKLVRAEVLGRGKILLSGAATTEKLRKQLNEFQKEGVTLGIVDGALSRLSLASPTVTESMILATGAAVSPNIQQLINKTRYIYRLINLPETEPSIKEQLRTTGRGLYGIDSEGTVHDLNIGSVFLINGNEQSLFRYGHHIYVSGAVSDRLIKILTTNKDIGKTRLVVQDFTKLFVSPEVYAEYHRRGGKIEVLQQSKLLAITLNPTSPSGYRLNSKEACQALEEALGIPVYDVVGDKRIINGTYLRP